MSWNPFNCSLRVVFKSLLHQNEYFNVQWLHTSCSAFPVQRSAHFDALLLLASLEVHSASLEVHCTSLEVYWTSHEERWQFRRSQYTCSYALQNPWSLCEVLHFAALQIHWKCTAVWSGRFPCFGNFMGLEIEGIFAPWTLIAVKNYKYNP